MCKTGNEVSTMIWLQDDRGFSLIEVMVSMVIFAIALLGIMSMFQWANDGLQDGARGAQALSMTETRIEAKRSAPWGALLMDDLDADGVAELSMQDAGTGGDAVAGDGIYSGMSEKDGIRLIWTIQPAQTGPMESAAIVLIKAQATYRIGARSRTVETGTLRANPSYVGFH